MLVVLSPAKTLDFATPPTTAMYTQPLFLDDAQALVDGLRTQGTARLAALMSISDELAELNAQRFRKWRTPFEPGPAKQAVLAFDGDVYDGLEARTLTAASLEHAQRRLRILSGLYGLLRPLDLMLPYRLEMGTRLSTPRGEGLYTFWGDRITTRLAEDAAAIEARALVNLASDEYFRAVRPARLPVPVVSPVFEDWKGDRFKVVSFWAKRARGAMARWIIEQRVDEPAALSSFAVEGYRFDSAASTDARPVFRRMH